MCMNDSPVQKGSHVNDTECISCIQQIHQMHTHILHIKQTEVRPTDKNAPEN